MRSQAVSYRITLVHGTFARAAAWTMDGSRLVRALQAGLDGPVAIERCPWSGGNSARARAAAAESLANQLRAQADRYPNEKRFVVAHSHGGNVALYALRDTTVAARVAGLACLATPFLVARRRDLGAKGVTNILAAVFLAVLLAYQLLIEPLLPPLLGKYGAVAFGFLALLTFSISLLLAYQRWDAWVERLLDSLRLADLPAPKLLLLRTTGDEASALLLFFQFLSMLAVRLFHLLQTLHARVEQRFALWSQHKLALIGMLVAGFAGFVAAVTAWLASGLSLTSGTAMFAMVVMTVLNVMLLFLLLGQAEVAAIFFRFAATVAVLPAALILALCMLPIDWRVAVANLFIDVTAETAPPGAWTLHQFVPRKADARGGEAPGLAHSAIYDDERAIGAIVEWILASGPSNDSEPPGSPDTDLHSIV